MISAILSRLVILLFGTLYPAYASYKAVRTKNVKEYVKWMMYWIVFALFTCAETFTDLFLSFWFPFYYEIKIVLVLWLLSPATKGSSILYRNFVHPALTKREQEIDEYISKAKEQGYHTMLQLGSKGVTYATNVIMQTAIKGGGGLVNHIRRSYSLSDLSDDIDLKSDLNRNSKLHGDTVDSADVPRDPRTRISRRQVGSHVDLYFPEMDVDIRSHPHELPVSLGQIRSSEDISSGYSSAGEGQTVEGNPLMRTASVGATRARGRGARSTAPAKKTLTTEEREDDMMTDYGWQHALPPLPITAIFPELLNLDPSALPPQAFLSPEALQIIYTNSMYRGHVPPSVYEMDEEGTDNTKSETPSENFNETEKVHNITEPKKNANSERDVENAKSETLESNPVNENSISNEKSNMHEVTINNSDEPLVNPNIGNIIEGTKKNNLTESESSSQTALSTEQITNRQENPSHEEVEQNECFEDASDDVILPASHSGGKISAENETLKSSPSSESLASSGDHCFEDSLPDVTLIIDSESPNERKGKYNKARAPPPPPDFKYPVGDMTVTENESTEINSESVQSDISVSQNNTFKSDEIQPKYISDCEEIKSENILSNYKRDISPSPSQKSKKDSSNFSRFLPKTSLFNLWGSKEESQKSTKSKVNVSRSPSNASKKSVSSGQFYTTSTSPFSSSQVGYLPDSGDRISRRDDNPVVSTPKLRLRQMSQSPSRKRHDFE